MSQGELKLGILLRASTEAFVSASRGSVSRGAVLFGGSFAERRFRRGRGAKPRFRKISCVSIPIDADVSVGGPFTTDSFSEGRTRPGEALRG